MRRHKCLAHLRFLSICSVIAALVGFIVTPLATAGNPTLYIDGIQVPLTQGGAGCGNDTGFKNGSNSIQNSCYSTLKIGNWFVGDASSSNQARVLINDSATGTDNMKLTGITFTRAGAVSTTTDIPSSQDPCPSCTRGTATIVQVMNNAPNGAGNGVNYSWAMSVGGQYDPTVAENVINDRFKLTGKGCFATTCSTSPTASSFTDNLGTIIDTGIFSSSKTKNFNGGISKSNSTTVVKTACNTGVGKCAPTIKYEYEFTVLGTDTLVLSDSLAGCGGQCSNFGPSSKMPPCQDIVDSTGATIPGILTICNQEIATIQAEEIASIIADGGAIVETCLGACIVIDVESTPTTKPGLRFLFQATGQGVADFPAKVDHAGNAAKAFSNLSPDSNPNIGDSNDRVFTIPIYPPGGSQGAWETTQITCTSSLNDNSASWLVDVDAFNRPSRLTVVTIAEGDILTCNWKLQ
jgi:hypothetical protein